MNTHKIPQHEKWSIKLQVEMNFIHSMYAISCIQSNAVHAESHPKILVTYHLHILKCLWANNSAENTCCKFFYGLWDCDIKDTFLNYINIRFSLYSRAAHVEPYQHTKISVTCKDYSIETPVACLLPHYRSSFFLVCLYLYSTHFFHLQDIFSPYFYNTLTSEHIYHFRSLCHTNFYMWLV